MDIRNNPFGYTGEGVMNRSKDARHHTNRAIAPLASGPLHGMPALLAQRARDVIIGPAVVRFSLPARDQHFRRTGFGGIGGKALAFLEALGLA
jgi:hypothetical protein